MRVPPMIVLSGFLMAASWTAIPQARAAETAGATQPSAKTCPICGKISQDDAPYATKAGTTLTRGATNTVFGWTELIRQPAAEVKAGGNVFTGIGKGLGEAVKRTFSGVGEILTFWTPKMNNQYVRFSSDCPICMKGTTGE